MTTQYKYTVNDILQIISDLRGESSINSDAVRIRAIDRALGDFSTRRFWEIYRINDKTTTSTGVNNYEIDTTFPCRSNGLCEVFAGGTAEANRYIIMKQKDFKKAYNEDSALNLCYQWFDATNDKWMIHLSPDTTGDTITYSYYWQHPTVTTTSSAVYIPDPDIAARRALAYLYEGEDEEKYQEQYKLSEQMANDWDEAEDQPAIGQLFAVSSNITRGIGDY